jgi:hypothetical protein
LALAWKRPKQRNALSMILVPSWKSQAPPARRPLGRSQTVAVSAGKYVLALWLVALVGAGSTTHVIFGLATPRGAWSSLDSRRELERPSFTASDAGPEVNARFVNPLRAFDSQTGSPGAQMEEFARQRGIRSCVVNHSRNVSWLSGPIESEATLLR